MDVADFFGIASGNKIDDKFERTGYHAVKSDKVYAPKQAWDIQPELRLNFFSLLFSFQIFINMWGLDIFVTLAYNYNLNLPKVKNAHFCNIL